MLRNKLGVEGGGYLGTGRAQPTPLLQPRLHSRERQRDTERHREQREIERDREQRETERHRATKRAERDRLRQRELRGNAWRTAHTPPPASLALPDPRSSDRLISFRKSTSPQNRQLNILIGNS